MEKPQFVYVTYVATTPEKLWNALIDSKLTARYWQHDNVSDWKPGSRFYPPGSPWWCPVATVPGFLFLPVRSPPPAMFSSRKGGPWARRALPLSSTVVAELSSPRHDALRQGASNLLGQRFPVNPFQQPARAFRRRRAFLSLRDQ